MKEWSMYIHLSKEDVRPLYQQITDQIKSQIMDGTLRAGEELPSIRQLARELLTSVITVKRAYDELEKEGYIHTKQGLGTFVASLSEKELDSIRYARAEEILKEALRKWHDLGLEDEEISRMLQNYLGEGGK